MKGSGRARRSVAQRRFAFVLAARDLVTDLFRRQTTETGISRAQALRQAMLALMDGPGYVQNGQTLYTYAHPMFWAPSSIVGDGG